VEVRPATSIATNREAVRSATKYVMSVALASTQDGPNRLATLAESHNIPPLVPANVQSGTSVPPWAPDSLAQKSQAVGAGESPPVHSPESAQSARNTFVPDADAATVTAALFSMRDRQRALTSLLHHLTVDPGPLPAPWAGEPPQARRVDNASAGFSGDCAMLELQNRPAHSHDLFPLADRARTGWQFAWLFVLAGVTGALVGWGTILQLPPLLHNTLPQQNTDPPVAANVRDSLPQGNTELPIAANVQSTTGAPPVVHDNLPQENAERSVAANVQSTTEAPPLVHESLPQQNTEPPVAANVQSTTGAPPLVHDSLPKLPLRAAEISPVQAQKSQLTQSVGSPPVPDADEIAALVKRGKDLAAHGDLISARLLLQRAAEAGTSAEAALALGETFDPLVFQRLGVIGIKPDAGIARKWYQRAAELGAPIASQYLTKLDRAP
jgi:hypothetical protein